SVAPAVDDIIVVDTGSTDDTAAVAARFGARVGHFRWCDDFAAARNASLELARGEWILWMDADDWLSPADRDKVARAKHLPPEQALYFTLVNTGGADRTRFRQVKMFPNHPQIRFERPVHETVLPALRRLGMAIASTDVEVLHSGYADAAVTARKRAYYRRLMEAWLADHPEDHDFCFRVGHTHYAEGRPREAETCFARILAAGRQAVQPEAIYHHAATFRGRCRLEAGDPEGAAQDFARGLAVRPDDVLANLSMGDALTKTGQYGRAIEHLQRALAGRPDAHFPLDTQLIEYSARFFLGQCCQAIGRFAEATAQFAAAVQLQPERPEAAEALRQSRLSAGRGEGEGHGTGLYGRSADLVRPESAGKGGRPGRLSLCMIVRDEEARLGRCLDSVRGLADEIVVVDTGSRDRTVSLAESHGARVGHFPWCDDFAAARNASLALATGDWIMWLDADDILPAEYHDQIRGLIAGERDRAYFYVLDDQGYENVSCLQMRLFPNLPGVAFEMPIHEQVTPSLGRLGVRLVPTEVRVVHTGYSTPEVVEAKKDRYLAIMERWLESHPGDYIVRSHVALTYHTTGRVEEAVEHYRAIIEESSCLADHNYVVYTTALLFLGRSLARLGRHEEARQWMHRAEEVDGDYVLTRFSLAEVYLDLGQPARAVEYARSVLEREPQLTFFPIDQRELTYSALCVCGRAHLQLQQLEEADGCFRRAAEVPVARRADALGSLSEVYRARGDRQAALEVLDRARQQDPASLKHIFNAGMLHLEGGNLEAAAAAFEEVLRRQPGYAPALLNLGFVAKSRGEPAAAEELYRRLLEQAPDSMDGRANLAHLYLGQERYAEAAAAFEAVRSAEPGLLDINLGLLLARVGSGTWDADLARAAFSQVGLSPEGGDAALGGAAPAAAAMVQLGAALTRAGQPRCAELAFRVAVFLADAAQARATASQARRCLGEVLINLGQFQPAVAQLEAVLLANPADGEAFRRLGDCYRQLGVAEAAQLCYQKAAELGPRSPAG
ncbi:MAG: glycosyltransferase, partial [Gemmatimonadota bacterium]